MAGLVVLGIYFGVAEKSQLPPRGDGTQWHCTVSNELPGSPPSRGWRILWVAPGAESSLGSVSSQTTKGRARVACTGIRSVAGFNPGEVARSVIVPVSRVAWTIAMHRPLKAWRMSALSAS